MPQSLQIPPPGFDALSVDEQIDYLQSLWEHIAARPTDIPVPDWHREVLRERLSSHQADEKPGQEWQDVETEITRQLHKPSR
ncbi:MAG TPA: addiction module protein [Pyrinomonadaceae bacterium]